VAHCDPAEVESIFTFHSKSRMESSVRLFRE